MGHDYEYGELMSNALDSQLDAQGLAKWNTHLANCPQCRERWHALRGVDHLFKHRAFAAPAPGFAGRFAERLARQHSAQRARQQTITGVGWLIAGAIAVLLMAFGPWVGELLALGGMSNLAAYLSGALQSYTQWAAFVRALSEVGKALAGFVMPWGQLIAMMYAGMWTAIVSSCIGLVWQTRRRLVFAPMQQA